MSYDRLKLALLNRYDWDTARDFVKQSPKVKEVLFLFLFAVKLINKKQLQQN